MKTFATYFQNDPVKPIAYGEVELYNPKRKRLRGETEKTGVEAWPVFCGVCGTDFELMHMGMEGRLGAKFPEGTARLINGHEGVVWVPEQNRFAIVLIRGGDSYDPTRYTEEERYFEYGCDQADGIFCDRGFFHPDMLLPLPERYAGCRKLPLEVAKRLSFADPYACAIFQLERMEDLGSAHNFRVEMAKNKCSEEEGRRLAKEHIFDKVVIFGLGMTGLFMADQIRRGYPNAKILLVGRSAELSPKVVFSREIAKADYLCTDGFTPEQTAQAIVSRLGGRASLFVGCSGGNLEHQIAFTHGVLGCNGIYDSFSLGPKIGFDTMPFGFQNHLIFSSINFRQVHMEKAIQVLLDSRYDEVVALIEKEVLTADPRAAYENKIFCKGAPLKTGVIWNPDFIEEGV